MVPPAVTVRELRQNLSIYLDRVEGGETFSVTKRGEPVAVLAPLPGRGGAIDRLAAEGWIIPATGRLEDLPPPAKPRPGQRPLSELLEETREDER